MREVEGFFNAKSFAVIGASREQHKPGNIIFRNLIKNKELKVFPINPKASMLLGNKCYEEISQIEDTIDCAIIVSPAKTIPIILRQIKKKGTENIIIISSGFSESGEEKLQEKIKTIIEELKLNVIGPNCFGLINPIKNVNATFYSGEIENGEIAFISQSGAIVSAILDKKEKLSGFISIGNQIDLDFADFIEYFSKDEKTKVICLYLESLKENSGKKFFDICKKVKKPIIILKANNSKKSQEAAKSHTAAIATDKKIYSSIFTQLGIIQADSVEKMFQIAKSLKYFNYEKIANKTGIITNAGGFGVIAADLSEKSKINLPNLKENTRKELTKILPIQSSLNNPIDILGDATPERYFKTLECLIKNKEFNNYVIILTPQEQSDPEKTAKQILRLKKQYNSNILACLIGESSIKTALIELEKEIPTFYNIEELFYCLSKIVE